MQTGTIVRISPPITANHNSKQDVIYNFGIFCQVVQTSPDIATVKLADGGYQYVYPNQLSALR